MTQSGQGEDPHLPSVRRPHEGIVLPADGSGPLMPGTTENQATPTEGTPWGQPWGPESAALPPENPAAPAVAPGEAWAPAPGAPPAPQWGTDPGIPQQAGAGMPLPPEHPGTGAGLPPGASMPLPPEQSGAPNLPPQPHPGADAFPPAQQPMPSALPPQIPPQPGAAPLPPAMESNPGGQPSFFGQGESLPQDAYGAGPLPPAGAAGGSAADEAATQYIPPVGPGALPPEQPRANPDETQRLGRIAQHQGRPPHGGHGGHGAAPQGQGAPAGQTAPPGPAGTFPGHQADPDNQPTQYIAPVPASPPGAPYGIRPGAPGHDGGMGQDGLADRQPPAEFDSLFRQPGAAGAAGAAGSTQQLPRVGPGAPGQGHAPYGTGTSPYGTGASGYDRAGHGQGGYSSHDDDFGGGRPRRGKGPLIAAVGIAIVVLGVGAGALLSQGGDGQDDKEPVSATAQTGDGTSSPSPSADPGEAQAGQLDKLLADSNDSRDSVISAVANVKSCKNLGQSASDLRDAAEQRGSLVTRLSGLAVDKLPNHEQLTAALNSAWKASAAADNHYAAWADEVSGNKKGCHKGQARTTRETVAGNRSSGEATRAKQRASSLWNTIAKKYGLTTRDKSEL